MIVLTSTLLIRNAALPTITIIVRVAIIVALSGWGEWARQILNIDTTMTGEALIVF